jgi:FixJ family two-component response regulator
MPKHKSIAFIHKDPSAGISLVRIAQSAELAAHLYDSIDAFLDERGRMRPDCVVLDASISDERDLELLKQLHDKKGCSTPFILLSRMDKPELRQRARQLGAAGFFREPVDGEALLDAIHWALGDVMIRGESPLQEG